MRSAKVGCLLIISLMMVFPCSIIRAAEVLKTTTGQALLVEGAEKARTEAVLDALGEALNSYIYDDRVVSHEFEQQINEKILQRRKAYVKSYEIQSERTLGDLYQVELKIELQRDLLEKELQKIEKGERQRVEHLTLLVLPPAGSVQNFFPAENGGAQALVLEPTALFQSLGQELAIYGFSLEMIDQNSPDLLAMLVQLLDAKKSDTRQLPEASWFQGLLPGDLIIVVRSTTVREERIVSLKKSFWQSQAEILFIDTRNEMITHLPKVAAKVISSDYIVGLEKLTADLTERVQKTSLDRLLRDYIVPQESEVSVVLQCQGFREPADFATFKKSVQALRTVKEVSLQALAPGSLELRLQVLTSAPLLVKWLNDYHSADPPFTLKAYPLDKDHEASRQLSVASGDEVPEYFLVRVNYAPATAD